MIVAQAYLQEHQQRLGDSALAMAFQLRNGVVLTFNQEQLDQVLSTQAAAPPARRGGDHRRQAPDPRQCRRQPAARLRSRSAQSSGLGLQPGAPRAVRPAAEPDRRPGARSGPARSHHRQLSLCRAADRPAGPGPCPERHQRRARLSGSGASPIRRADHLRLPLRGGGAADPLRLGLARPRLRLPAGAPRGAAGGCRRAGAQRRPHGQGRGGPAGRRGRHPRAGPSTG